MGFTARLAERRFWRAKPDSAKTPTVLGRPDHDRERRASLHNLGETERAAVAPDAGVAPTHLLPQGKETIAMRSPAVPRPQPTLEDQITIATEARPATNSARPSARPSFLMRGAP